MSAAYQLINLNEKLLLILPLHKTLYNTLHHFHWYLYKLKQKLNALLLEFY